MIGFAVSLVERDDRPRSATEQRPYARDEFPHAKRLGQVVVGAAFQADHFVRLLAARGQHQHRHVGIFRFATDRAADGHAVQSRQHDVEDDEIEVAAARQLQRAFAVAALDALVVLQSQVQTDELADVRFVFDDQDGGTRRGGGFHRSACPRPQSTHALLESAHPYSTPSAVIRG